MQDKLPKCTSDHIFVGSITPFPIYSLPMDVDAWKNPDDHNLLIETVLTLIQEGFEGVKFFTGVSKDGKYYSAFPHELDSLEGNLVKLLIEMACSGIKLPSVAVSIEAVKQAYRADGLSLPQKCGFQGRRAGHE